MTGTKQILISHVFSTYESETEELLAGKTLSQVCSTDENELKSIISDESSTEESKTECVQRNINKEKDAKNEAEHDEPTVTDDPIFVKDPIYFNIFESGKNILNRIDTTCEQACMETSRDK